MNKNAIEDLNLIIARTAALSGGLRQFEMITSRCYQPASVDSRIQSLQEHVEQLYGMVQRVCALITANESEPAPTPHG
jgi:hypothetical protein